MKSLYEIATTMTGESYCRAYVWIENGEEEDARRLFKKSHPNDTILGVTLCFHDHLDGDCDFCTDINDSGWPPDHYGPVIDRNS